MKFTEACDVYFGSKDLYGILKISKQASQKEVRKAYHKLSLVFHPDRVEEESKDDATEKFKVLSKIHEILSDPEKRTVYDETGIWTEEDDDASFDTRDWSGYWNTLFNNVTFSDLDKLETEYKGSEEELEDLKDAYLKCKGDMDKMYQYILFAKQEEEERIRERILDLIEKDELPAYDIFINEPQAKRDKRMKKMRREAKLAEKEEKRIREKSDTDLSDLILSRRQVFGTESFLDAMEKKYAGPKMSEKTPKKSSRGKGKK